MNRSVIKMIQRQYFSSQRIARHSVITTRPMRMFAQVRVEEEQADKSNSGTKAMKPNFILQFDKNDRLLVYSSNYNYFYALLAATSLVVAYSLYQIVVKWYRNNKWKNILCLFLFPCSAIALIIMLKSTSWICTRVYLKSDGRHIVYRRFMPPKNYEIPIKDIRQSNDMVVNLMDASNTSILSLPNNKTLVINMEAAVEPYFYDIDIFKAIIKGQEIQIDQASSQTMIDL